MTGTQTEPARTTLPGRGAWALRDHPTTLWLTAALVVVTLGRSLPASDWLLVHLVLLGAVTHAAMVWSTHFAQALLKTPPTLDGRRQQSRRLALLLVGTTLVLIGVPTAWWPVTLAGATAVTAAVLWHGIQLWRRLRAALPGRFRVTLRYYLCAAAWVPVGATLGVLLARQPADPWHGRLIVAHSMAMALGWLGLTMTGTLVTLWPTMLRTRIDDRAESLARQALPWLNAALAVAVTGALVDLRAVTVTGLLGYAAGLVWWSRALVAPARRRPPRQFATVSVSFALLWLIATIVGVALSVALLPDWATVGEHYVRVAAALAVGFALQLVMGALSYLIPTVLGGGPSVVRATGAWFDRGALARVLVVNVGLVVCLLPVPDGVRAAVGVLVVVALAAFLPLVGLAVRERIRAGRASRADGQPETLARGATVTPCLWSPSQLVSAVAAIALAVAAPLGARAAGLLDAAGSPWGTSEQGAADVTPTGHTTTVHVEARGMRFSPASVTVPRGDRLVIHLVNTDETTTHDLVLSNGAHASRLAPGDSADLDVELVSGPIDGWCSVVGHRQMGMVFHVVVSGDPNGTATDASAPGMSGMPMTTADSGATGLSTGSPAPLDPEAGMAPGFTAYDPVLAPLGTERVHRLTLTVEEAVIEVAPGVWQRRWTYNGRSPGPTLHGRVGDRFEITLVNHGTMGHSIDFHAGSFAPDDVVRTIAPGRSLTVGFTATRAGIWMYHCSTMPMSAHIAAGMVGAVVIEPPGLAPVDRSYLLVQSEIHLGSATGQATATEVDADKVSAERPDAVAFNGVAFQYDKQPLRARVGERVRFWVLDAGPSRVAGFHVVGAQFDTVYAEGAWLLRPDATRGGSQTLSLGVSQGGFVETTFAAAGHYPFVNHVMVDAERGARGSIEVTAP